MIAISLLLHIYLVQYGQYFPRFSFFAFFSLTLKACEISRQNIRNSENISDIALETGDNSNAHR